VGNKRHLVPISILPIMLAKQAIGGGFILPCLPVVRHFVKDWSPLLCGQLYPGFLINICHLGSLSSGQFIHEQPRVRPNGQFRHFTMLLGNYTMICNVISMADLDFWRL
jgi:hypothetical protein